MASRTRDRESAGRLLRVIQDCELFHMEAAIASLDRVKPRIRSESLLKSSGGDAVDVLECTTEGRVLSLSDHKKIARVQAALSTVANAYDTRGDVDFTTAADAGRNLVCTVAGAAMMQSTRACTASRANCCIWGPQTEKLHVLLDWMLNRESVVESSTPSCGYVRQLLLEWIQPTAEKQNQLAACLTLFELLQRHRRKWMGLSPGSEIACLLGERVGNYLDALRQVVDHGTVRVVGSHRVKPSKLALIALETMALLCGDIAAQFMSADDSAKNHLSDDGLMRKAVEAMRFFVKAQLQWHSHSTRRQFLMYVLRHLQSYVEACAAVLHDPNGHASNSVAALGVLCWHWEATAPLFCTRSAAASRIQQNEPTEMFVRVVKKWSNRILHNSTSPEVGYAQLHYVCILMDSMGGSKGCAKAFESFLLKTKAYFAFFIVKGLSKAVKNGDEAAVVFTLKVLKTVFSASSGLNLLSTKDEEQEVLSQLLRIHGNAHMPYGASGSVELEFLVADFIISRALFITELVRRTEDSHNGKRQSCISLVRTFLYQLDGSSQTTLCQHWRRELAPAVLSCIDAEDYLTRQLALSCLPSLDVVSCVARLCVAGIRGSETSVVTSALGYLFASSTQTSLKAMSLWFFDACQFGSVPTDPIRGNPPASPSEWNTFACQLEGSSKDPREEEVRKEVQEKLLSLCIGPKGYFAITWSHRVQAANARREIIGVLLQKILGSPRDTMLFRLLRDFVGCGWVDGVAFGPIETQISTHMMNLQRLTEEFLDDNSSFSAKAVEGLLFARLAPLLVLRMIPRGVFTASGTHNLLCGREDLDHLNEFVDSQQLTNLNDTKKTLGNEKGMPDEVLFHILARSMVDPLEFKEVKMLATECVAKVPAPRVMPFVLAYLVAFVREASSNQEPYCSIIVDETSVPDSCGLVTAKLMVYYLNRVFSEDASAYLDEDIISKALVVLVQILGLPCAQEGGESLLTVLQRGCIDCFALILSRLAASEDDKMSMTKASSLMNLLLSWIFGAKFGESIKEDQSAETLGRRVQHLLEKVWGEARHHEFPLQVRICCCNILLSAILRSENNVLSSWKDQGVISRIALATEDCFEECVIAGGLQIIFSFLYKASDILSMEDNGDLQLVCMCYEATATRLESTQSELVAMNGLKVVGALIGKLPAFIGTLPPAELQRLIDRCLITVRDRQVSPVVSELAQSLLQTMSPP